MPLQTSPESPAPLRVISQAIGSYISRMGAVWVEGEIAQMTRRAGMSFLTLRDLEAKVSISLNCSRAVMDSISPPLTEGARVVVHARPEFYQPSGRLSLNAREIRPVGIGELLARLEQRRQLLAAEGLFDARRKKPLPFLPARIGLITGRNSAAEKDVVENTRLRWPGVDIHIVYALMQGQSSAREVIAAVRQLDADESIDVIVIARGGGSVEDLLPFSDEGLIRAVAAATTAVVSAIGHEPDTPILDLVADVRASTPTDAAKRIVPDVREELAGIAMMRERASVAARSLLQRETHGLATMRTRPVLANPMIIVDQEADRLIDARKRARRSLQHRLDRTTDDVVHQLARVRALSPLSTLARGYAIAQRADGSIITSIDHVEPSSTWSLRVTDGHIHATTDSTTAIKEPAHD